MFTVEHHPGDLSTVELRDHHAGSVAALCPERGGMATRLHIAGDELFFLDDDSFRDTARNVRGGNPVLFPSPGKLHDDRWARDGHHGAMKQHGFARNLAWRVADTHTADAASVTLTLQDDDLTRAMFPWSFKAAYTYALAGDSLRISQRFTNTGDKPMPFGAGFHPYFLVPQADKAQATIDTAASRVFDNVTKAEIPFDGFDLTAQEVDYHLLDHGSAHSVLTRPHHDRHIHLDCSPEFTHWVVWTKRDRDFVCLEPWTCPGDALNTGDRLMTLAPGDTREVWMTIGYR